LYKFIKKMTILLQQILVSLIFFAIIIFILKKIYVFFKTNKSKKDILSHNCENCVGCDLKEFIQQKT
jgi:hypothetical protein